MLLHDVHEGKRKPKARAPYAVDVSDVDLTKGAALQAVAERRVAELERRRLGLETTTDESPLAQATLVHPDGLQGAAEEQGPFRVVF